MAIQAELKDKVEVVEDLCREIDGGERMLVVVQGNSKSAVEGHDAYVAVREYCRSQHYWPARLSPVVDGLSRVPSDIAGEEDNWRLNYRMVMVQP